MTACTGPRSAVGACDRQATLLVRWQGEGYFNESPYCPVHACEAAASLIDSVSDEQGTVTVTSLGTGGTVGSEQLVEHIEAARAQAFAEVAQVVNAQYRQAFDEFGRVPGGTPASHPEARRVFWIMDTWCLALQLVRSFSEPQSPVVPSVGAVPVEVPHDMGAVVKAEFDRRFALDMDDAEKLFSRPSDWSIESVLRLAAPLIAARVRAEERQRCIGELTELHKSGRTPNGRSPLEYGSSCGIHFAIERLAAGSAVPVATPTEPVTCQHGATGPHRVPATPGKPPGLRRCRGPVAEQDAQPVDWCKGTPEQVAEAHAEVAATEARYAHGWEYATTTGPRKAWDAEDVPPEGGGWVRDTARGDNGWERFDYHEESYWKRPKPVEQDGQR